MKVFVISEGQIKKAAYAAVAFVLVAFVSGYYLGSESASSAIPVNANFSPDVPEKTEVVDAAPVEKTELKKIKKTDTKKSEHKKADAKKKEKAKKTAETKSQKNKAIKSKEVNKVAETKKSKQLKKPEKKEVQKGRADKNKVDKTKTVTGDAGKKRTEKEKSDQSASLVNKQALTIGGSRGDATSEGRVYSIQAGMFASEANAKSFIGKLAEKKFEAYVSDFVSTSGAIKYNVRVGRFEQRDQARVLLREFQKSFSSPAYVVITE